MSMEAKVRRTGGTKQEREIRAAENDLKTARFARDRAYSEWRAQGENAKRCDAALARAETRLALLTGRAN